MRRQNSNDKKLKQTFHQGETTIFYGNIKKTDIADGPGVRVSLFVSGCRNRCKECFQPETWAFDYGRPFTEETEKEILSALSPEFISGLTVLGGEPLEPENQQTLLPFLKKVKKQFPDKTVWLYSGFTFEELFSASCRACTPEIKEILTFSEVLVDGRFMHDKKNLLLKFRGSSNQRLIDLKTTLEKGKVTLWEGSSHGLG